MLDFVIDYFPWLIIPVIIVVPILAYVQNQREQQKRQADSEKWQERMFRHMDHVEKRLDQIVEKLNDRSDPGT